MLTDGVVYLLKQAMQLCSWGTDSDADYTREIATRACHSTCLCTLYILMCVSYVVDVSQHYPPALQVTVYTVDTSSALLERLESLQTRIIEGNVRLIILDSVAALARRVGTSITC